MDTATNRKRGKAAGWLLSAVGVVTCLFLAVRGAEPPSRSPAQPSSPSDAEFQLPDVEKTPPSQQPISGLPSDTHLQTAPPRATKGLDLVKLDWSYNCMECHRSLEVKWHRDRVRVEHESIHLNHGNNRFCLNCHNPTNMNTFVDYDGSAIAEENVVLLCAKCHGTVYRDWEAGVHGRRNGYWDTKRGQQTRLRCIQCHDPHDPQFKSMQALPALHYPARAAGHGPSKSQAEH